MRLVKASPKAPADKKRMKNTASKEIGKPNENKFSCGAERVIMPIDAFTINNTNATGIMIMLAAKNIAPAASITLFINNPKGGVCPSGKISYDASIIPKTSKCPSIEKNKTVKNK